MPFKWVLLLQPLVNRKIYYNQELCIFKEQNWGEGTLKTAEDKRGGKLQSVSSPEILGENTEFASCLVPQQGKEEPGSYSSVQFPSLHSCWY